METVNQGAQSTLRQTLLHQEGKFCNVQKTLESTREVDLMENCWLTIKWKDR